ncbi:LicD family protein [Nocardioides yefusunii]|uniref:Phosphorylcholine transferase LicD n=1 Tax=Nocardioides yefusunii TaxID=2500546 RepID=A0ABW1QTR7_9ACTN|nr:LicD family protein [Nocardioides yefusunii]
MASMSADEVRSVQIQTLREVVSLCERSGIRYQLTYGTLLGAARHAGFIPWDDDIDVMMPRSDYTRFLTEAATHLPQFQIGRPGDAWPFGFAKIWDRRTQVVEDANMSFTSGVGIDIWPVDDVASSGWRRTFAFSTSRALQALETLRSVRARHDHSLPKRLVLVVSQFALNRLPISAIGTLRDRLARSAVNGSGDLGILVGSYPWAVDAALMATGSGLPFEEEGSLAVPSGWDYVLTTMYGDYMQLPPADKQVTHHAYTAYWIPAESSAPRHEGQA